MKELIFASNNRNKVFEIQSAIGEIIKVIPLNEAGIDIDIPEPHNTLEENASEKSRTIYRLTGRDCFSEDTGLEVKALNGEPGVKSARYAGEARDSEENIKKLLQRLLFSQDRGATFRTVISLIYDRQEYLFEGICEGRIAREKRGSQGFGYDAVFVPSGSNRTFAQMDIHEKNRFSHRRHAADKLVLFLQQQINKARTP